MSRTTPPAEPTEVLIPVGEFIESDSHAIPVAGLLASDPELREARLTRADWQTRLDEYLATPTA